MQNHYLEVAIWSQNIHANTQCPVEDKEEEETGQWQIPGNTGIASFYFVCFSVKKEYLGIDMQEKIGT